MPGSQITYTGINNRRSATRLSLPNLLGIEGLWSFNIADHDVARMNLVPGKPPATVKAASAPILTGLNAQFNDAVRFYETSIVEADAMTFMAIVQFPNNRAQLPVILGNRFTPNLRGSSAFGVNFFGVGATSIALGVGTTNAAGDTSSQEAATVSSSLAGFHLLVGRYTPTSIRVDNLSEGTSGTNNAFTAGSVRDKGSRPFRIGSSGDGYGNSAACSIHTIGMWSRYLSDGEMNETAKAMGQIAVEDALNYSGPSYSG